MVDALAPGLPAYALRKKKEGRKTNLPLKLAMWSSSKSLDNTPESRKIQVQYRIWCWRLKVKNGFFPLPITWLIRERKSKVHGSRLNYTVYWYFLFIDPFGFHPYIYENSKKGNTLCHSKEKYERGLNNACLFYWIRQSGILCMGEKEMKTSYRGKQCEKEMQRWAFLRCRL